MEIVHADHIKRVPVPKNDRTKAKDEAAEWIEKMWPDTLTNIAERSGYSRQHVKNTLVKYFEITDEPPQEPDNSEVEEKHKSKPVIELDVMKLIEVYRMGYRDGLQDARLESDGEESIQGSSGISDVLGVAEQSTTPP